MPRFTPPSPETHLTPLVPTITGHTGSAVVDTLLAANKPLRTPVRDPAKASAWAAKCVEIATGDVADAGALAKDLCRDRLSTPKPPIFLPPPCGEGLRVGV